MKASASEEICETVEKTLIKEECKVEYDYITRVKIKKYKEKVRYIQNPQYKKIKLDLNTNELITKNLSSNYMRNIRENEEFAIINKNELSSPENSEDEEIDYKKSFKDRTIVVPIVLRQKDIPKPIAPFEITRESQNFVRKKAKNKICKPINFQINSLYEHKVYDPSEYEDYEVDEKISAVDKKKKLTYINKDKPVKLKDELSTIVAMNKFSSEVEKATVQNEVLSKAEIKALFLSQLENIKQEIEELVEYQNYDMMTYLKECEQSLHNLENTKQVSIVKNLNLFKNDCANDLRILRGFMNNYSRLNNVFETKIRELKSLLRHVLTLWIKNSKDTKKKTAKTKGMKEEEIGENSMKAFLDIIGLKKLDDLEKSWGRVKEDKEIDFTDEKIKKEFTTFRSQNFNKYFDVVKSRFMNRETRIVSEKNINNSKLFKFYENGVIEIIESSSTLRRIFPDGHTCTQYNNKNLKHCFPEGDLLFFHNTKLLYQLILKETDFLAYKLRNETIEKVMFNGMKYIKYLNGNCKIITTTGVVYEDIVEVDSDVE